MPKLTMTVPVTIHFLWHKGQEPTVERQCAAIIPGIPPSLSIIHTRLPTEEDLEEWLWEAKDEWEED